MPQQKSPMPRISLEHWAVFKTLVDEGSFAKAAEKLHKSQSSVSYSVQALSRLLPVAPLQMQGRRAVLTEAGKWLYRQATQLLAQAAALEQSAAYLAGGWETEVVLALEALTPMAPVLAACEALAAASPTTRVRLLETTLSGTDEALLNRQCHMAVMARVPPGYWPQALCQVAMVPVVRADHPALASGQPISEAQLRSFRQVVLRDTGTQREQDAGWLGAEQRLTVSHLSTSLQAVEAGLGFAFLPEHRVAPGIAAGRLAVLPLEDLRSPPISLSLVMAQREAPGPGARWFADQLLAACRQGLA
jgi:DNA-binding transcriptional LysR family regulator